MKNKIFNGVITAIATPFLSNKIDLLTFEKLLRFQIDSDVNAIVLFGTTGEGESLSLNEKKILFLLAKKIIQNKIPLICSISTPITAKAVSLAKNFYNWGCDGLLVITPYYYKTSDEGLIFHFDCIAKSTPLPIIIYNVPQRTGCDLFNRPSAMKKINEINNVVATKDCPDSVDRFLKALSLTDKPILCGTDNVFSQALIDGYDGCISVFSNIFPEIAVKIYQNFKNNNFTESQKYFQKILPFIKVLELEPNPITIKHAISLAFECSNELRLPLTSAKEETQREIEVIYNKIKEEL